MEMHPNLSIADLSKNLSSPHLPLKLVGLDLVDGTNGVIF